MCRAHEFLTFDSVAWRDNGIYFRELKKQKVDKDKHKEVQAEDSTLEFDEFYSHSLSSFDVFE